MIHNMNTCSKLQHIINKCIVCDWPESRSRSDYDDVRNAYIRALKVPVKSIYQVGSVGAPGISDLDLFVILDDVENARFKDFSNLQLSKEQRYIMTHEPWVVNESIFEKLNRLFPYFELIHVHGANFEVDVLDRKGVLPEYAFVFLSEYVVTKIPRVFVDMLHGAIPMSVRFSIVLINSLRHSIGLYYISGGERVVKWDLFIDNFDEFRKTTFTGSLAEEAELKQYFFQAIIISYQLIEKMDDLLNSLFLSNSDSRFNDNCLSGFYSVRFVKDWSVDRALYEAVYRYKYGSDWLLLPASLQSYWMVASKDRGVFGCYISKILGHDTSLCELTINDAIASHVEVINEYIEFSRQRLSYRGSIWLTLGAGDELFVRYARLMIVYLKRVKLKFS